jgi:drug/metabolite transporter (DMT)-like permease
VTTVAAASQPVTVPADRRALGAVGLAVIGWSASTLFVRAAHADPVVFTTWRLWFALPPLTAIVWWRRRTDPEVQLWPRQMSARRWLLLLGGGGAFFAGGAATAFAAIDMTTLLDVTLITSLQPVIVIAFAVAVLRERVAGTQFALGAVAVAGTILVSVAASGSGGTWSLAGDVVAIVSLVVNAGWFLYGRVLRARFPVDPFAFMLGVLAAAAVLLTPVAIVKNGGLHLPAPALGYAALTMVTGTTAHLFMVWAHRYVRASVSAPLLLAEPPLVAVGAWLCFGETLGPIEVVGSLIVVITLFGMVRSPALEDAGERVADPVGPV